MKTVRKGSVRIDLLGGTLDIYPINLILPNVVTLNMATNLMACVSIEPYHKKRIIFNSEDYKVSKDFSIEEVVNIDDNLPVFGQFEFLARILSYFEPAFGLQITLSSDAPPGSGLGGSSAMGATFFSACCDHFSTNYSRNKIVAVVQSIESKILNAGPAGYQDYYPSLFGGVLALKAKVEGVKVEQLY